MGDGFFPSSLTGWEESNSMPCGWRLLGFTAFALLGFGVSMDAMADQPRPWEFGMQTAVTPVMEQISGFHDFLLIIISAITLFVMGLLLYIILRFNAKANPTPSTTTHNTPIEVLWTVIPILILVVVAIPSFRLLYYTDRIENAEITVKAIGHQWYWTYVYPDHDDLTFDAFIATDDDLSEGAPRLLATDTAVVLPVDTTVRLLTTSTDVLHAWAIPAFGVKVDSIPGRLHETWFRVEKEGTYYGQCSELCGTNHGFMPIVVKIVSKEAYEAWLQEAKEEYATNGGADRQLRVARTDVRQ